MCTIQRGLPVLEKKREVFNLLTSLFQLTCTEQYVGVISQRFFFFALFLRTIVDDRSKPISTSFKCRTKMFSTQKETLVTKEKNLNLKVKRCRRGRKMKKFVFVLNRGMCVHLSLLYIIIYLVMCKLLS